MFSISQRRGGKKKKCLIVIVTDGWASIHNTFQSVPLDCFPEQNENPYNKAEYILPAQVHQLYSHSPPQSSSVRVEDMGLYIYFALAIGTFVVLFKRENSTIVAKIELYLTKIKQNLT